MPAARRGLPMFSEADAFLDAIWAAPGDATPRLVYADWLEEHGYADYAQFIRLCCRLDREVFPPDERTRLRRQRYDRECALKRTYPQAFTHANAYLTLSDGGIPRFSHSAEADTYLRDWPQWW